MKKQYALLFALFGIILTMNLVSASWSSYDDWYNNYWKPSFPSSYGYSSGYNCGYSGCGYNDRGNDIDTNTNIQTNYYKTASVSNSNLQNSVVANNIYLSNNVRDSYNTYNTYRYVIDLSGGNRNRDDRVVDFGFHNTPQNLRRNDYSGYSNGGWNQRTYSANYDNSPRYDSISGYYDWRY